MTASGGLDFDDLVIRAIERLEADPALLARWRSRCAELLVDEVQDVDRAQLRLALLLAAPANRIFLVGDDDQSIYGWRLADVRRILGLAEHLPGLRRVDLEVNYRCPRHVVERAVRLVEHNGERFAKTIRAGPAAAGRLVLAPDPSDETVRLERAVRSWPDDDSTRAVLARTNRELLPAVVVALRLGLPFRAPRIELLVDSPHGRRVARPGRPGAGRGEPLLISLGRVRDEVSLDGGGGEGDVGPRGEDHPGERRTRPPAARHTLRRPALRRSASSPRRSSAGPSDIPTSRASVRRSPRHAPDWRSSVATTLPSPWPRPTPPKGSSSTMSS